MKTDIKNSTFATLIIKFFWCDCGNESNWRVLLYNYCHYCRCFIFIKIIKGSKNTFHVHHAVSSNLLTENALDFWSQKLVGGSEFFISILFRVIVCYNSHTYSYLTAVCCTTAPFASMFSHIDDRNNYKWWWGTEVWFKDVWVTTVWDNNRGKTRPVIKLFKEDNIKFLSLPQIISNGVKGLSQLLKNDMTTLRCADYPTFNYLLIVVYIWQCLLSLWQDYIESSGRSLHLYWQTSHFLLPLN